MENLITAYDTTLAANCFRCYNSGVVVQEIYPGANLFQPCSCSIARDNRLKAEQEMRMMLQQCEVGNCEAVG